MIKNRNRSIAVIAVLALLMSLIPSAAFGASGTVKTVTGLEADQMSNTSVELNWDYVNGSEGYKIYRAASKTGKYTLVKTLKSGDTTTYTNKSLKLGNTYYYKVKAVDTVYGKQKLSSKFSKAVSVKMEQCVPKYTIEFPEKLNDDGSLTITITNNSEKEIQLAPAPIVFNDLKDWSKDGILLKAVKYENLSTGYTDTEDLNIGYVLFKGETVKATYELNKELQGTVSGLKGEEMPKAIPYKKGGEGFGIGITYKGLFFYMAIQYPDGQKLLTLDEYMEAIFNSMDPAQDAAAQGVGIAGLSAKEIK